MKGSLRARMAAGFTASFALFAFVACLAFGFWANRTALRDAEERVASAAQHLAIEWKDRTPREAFEEVHEDARLDDVAMSLVGKDGRILGSDAHPALPWPIPPQGWVAATADAPQGTAAAGMAWSPIADRLRAEIGLLAAFAVVATGTVGAAAWVLVGRTLRPIGRLADGADAASSDALHAQLAAPSDDVEIAHLVATLNRFLGRLAEGARNREQFYASAAHELRTPLAVLSAEVEVALSRPRTTAEYEETLHDLQGQVRRLISLVEALLTLNRLEVSSGGEEPERIDPADVAERTLAALQPSIQARSLHVEVRLGAGFEVAAPPNHLAVVVRNLLENAVRHAPEGGRIEVVADGGLRIENDVPVGTSLDFDRMFEPFVQGDASRAGEGNGLGLAICRRIAQIDGWELTLRQTEGQVTAELRF